MKKDIHCLPESTATQRKGFFDGVVERVLSVLVKL